MSAPDDQRTVTVTVATLKAFEAAVIAHYAARLVRINASTALDVAKDKYERSLTTETEACDAQHAAIKALYAPFHLVRT